MSLLSLQDGEVFGKQASPASGSAPALGDSGFWIVYFLLANIRGEVKRKTRRKRREPGG